MPSPPRYFQKLLRWFCREDCIEEVENNLLEIFEKQSASSVPGARRRFAWNVVCHFQPAFLKFFASRKNQSSNFSSMQMLLNYLSVAGRVFRRNRSYVIINALGLGFALASCFAGYLFVAYNIEFNNYYSGITAPNVYMIQMETSERDGTSKIHDMAPIMLGGLAAQNIAGVKNATRLAANSGSFAYHDHVFGEYFSYSDSTFFDIFELPLIAGSHKAFKNKNTIFITESIAKKYFGDTDAVGKSVILGFNGNKQIDAQIGGVLAEIPVNSSVNFNILARFELFIDINGLDVNDWKDWRDPTTFVQLVDAENALSLSAQLQKYVQPRNDARMDMKVTRYVVNPFGSNEATGYGWINRPMTTELIVIFCSMALAILLIACFNLTNTSIALTAKRLKEVGVRKTMGALRGNIAAQFLIESTIMVFMAMIVGLVLAQFVVPVFANMWGLQYGLGDLSGLNLLAASLFLIFAASVVAGSYPALLGSALRPAGLLKGTHRLKGTGKLTRVLVAVQFALSTIVLIAGVTFTQNAAFQDSLDFGYEKEKIIHLDIGGKKDYDLVLNALASNPYVESIGVSDGAIGRNTYGTPARIGAEEYDVRVLGVGDNYLETLGLRMIEGNAFQFGGDYARGVLIVNEAFVKKTGLIDPIGQTVTMHNSRYQIVGIVENHIDDVYRSREAAPFAFHPTVHTNFITLAVRADPANVAQLRLQMEEIWKQLFPGKPFSCQLQDDVLLAGSRSVNANLKEIFTFLTVLGGLLAVCGIFALASLNVSYRTKEIGIRKVLGASVQNVVGIMNTEFVVILLCASIIGACGGYYATTSLLDSMFAIHSPVMPFTITICCLVIFLVGTFTTTITIARVATANPVNSLRSE
jgi:ABC-type antimicrobial peptide transport system permease subunit